MEGAAPGTAIRTGLYLAQAGEFGFVLLALATERGLLPQALQTPVLASMVLSMLATPLFFVYSHRIVMRLSANDWLLQSVAMTSIAKRTINTETHVIICGFGRSGQNLARLLEAEKIAYIALDLAPSGIRVNSVQPGMTHTPATDAAFANEAMMAAFRAQQAIDRGGEVEDIAQAVRYFAGPESSWTTGQCLTVDGGNTLRAFIDYEQLIPIPDQRAVILGERE